MRARSRRSFALAVAAVAAVLVSSTALATPGGAAGRAWRLSIAFRPPVDNLASVACFSATGCVAVGWSTLPNGTNPTPLELRTEDGGALWSPVRVPHAAATLAAVVCDGSLCLAGGSAGAVLRSTDGGLTWTAVTLPAPIAEVVALACPTTSVCEVAGSQGGTTPSGLIASSADGGQTWTVQYSETSANLQSLWCASATSCFAYGTTFYSTSDGTTWGPYAAPTGFPTQAVCSTSTLCVGSSPSEGVVTSPDGGQTWAISDGSVVPTSLACASATTCVGTDGTNIVATTDAANTWSAVAPAYGVYALAAVACLSADNCQVLGSATADGYPSRALALEVAPATQALNAEVVTDAVDVAGGVSCPSAAVCAFSGSDPYGNPVVLRTTNGGAAWVDLPLPSTFAKVDDVVCPRTTACLAVGGNADGEGAVWGTGDGGATWSAARVPATVGEVSAVTCATPARCVAVGYLLNSWTAVLTTTDGGLAWSVVPMPHTATDLYGAACPTTQRCVAVGGSNGTAALAFYSMTGGRSWRPARVAGGLHGLFGVACPSALICLAAGQVHGGAAAHGVVARSADGGLTWAPVLAPGHTASVLALACYSQLVCEAVGQTSAAANPMAPSAAAALVTTTAGRSWSTQALPPGVWSLDALGCSRSGVCVAAGMGNFEPPRPPTGAVVLRLG